MPKRTTPRGHILVEEMKLEGGITVPVTMCKEDGSFHAVFNERHRDGEDGVYMSGQRWGDGTLEGIRIQIRKWHQEASQLRWEPVIVLYPGSRRLHSDNFRLLGCDVDRLMRAKKISGKGYEWRHWGTTHGDHLGDRSRSFVEKEDLEVPPPSGMAGEPTAWGGEGEPVLIAYTPERWSSLLKLYHMEEELRARMREIVNSDEEVIDAFLGRVRTNGLLAFQPKEDSAG
jgi:hypothetical protein